ncbi:hypothetical protein FNU76_01980 [Chitinimonas arctica]|uniref:Uncharacterized protein n=1 Tax=Chitinimonas arctica TaxID=2594795 RepID=A0A516SAP8_9NEIS|nr:hypothetical protein [Chitinimonas arctica]QDQ25216.1 hypothetical protein FNU76_01980 [Chitinimonas arctica]
MESMIEKCSHRLVGEAFSDWKNTPTLPYVFERLADINAGRLECLTLFTTDGKNMMFLGKPGLTHICLFASDKETYIFDNGTADTTKVDIAGDYWPSFQLCRDGQRSKDIAREFCISGRPLAAQKWIHYVES